MADGKIDIEIARTFALADAAAAPVPSESGHPGGEIPIDPS